MDSKTMKKIANISILLLLLFLGQAFSQVEGTEKRYIRVGSLQSHFTAYGSERAWTGRYYAGLIWPADYQLQDNAVIKRTWIAAKDFTDERGQYWEKYGLYFVASDVGRTLFPVKLEETGKFENPLVYVDGNNLSSVYSGDVDYINPDQIADRIVTNVVNTYLGLTMTRRIYAFSQQYHDNYFIKEFIFKNTGNTDYDDEIELHEDLKGVYISWGTRYSVCREAAKYIGGQAWGERDVPTRRGETYPQEYMKQITESTPFSELDFLRCAFAWAGQNKANSYDNIGAPDLLGYGRLTAIQHAGIVTLHVDKSVTDRSDDPYQPSTLGWHAGDTYPGRGTLTAGTMKELYYMLQGHPYGGANKGGTNRFDETYITTLTYQKDPHDIHGDDGGANIWFVYGPFDIPFGDSIRIVEAEGIAGLSRTMAENIGRRWFKAYKNKSDNGPFVLPDGSTTNDKDVFKNTWVFTGKDSILLTFSRAKRNFDVDFDIPQPPLPPRTFDVKSGGDKIYLSWTASPSESDPDFGGYRIYRAVGKPDTTYQEIFACGKNTANPEIVHEFADRSAIRGFPYYYYIVAFNDGSNNTDGYANPPGELHSGKFYTWATEPAYLTRPAGKSLDDIRIVPNPYNISARDFNYWGEPDKIMFLNIPAYCKIKIYTERGDLIKTIIHDDGSGDEAWNAVTSSRQTIVSGLYIAYFEVTKDYTDPETQKILYRKGDHIIKKFVVIR